MMEISYLVLLGTLGWASIHDLIKLRVPDYVFIIGGLAILLASFISSGSLSLLGMGKYLMFMIILGIFLNILVDLGMADVFALGLIGMTFPQVPFHIVVSLVFTVMYAWILLYSKLLRKEKVPAIPGLLGGSVALLIYLDVLAVG